MIHISIDVEEGTILVAGRKYSNNISLELHQGLVESNDYKAQDARIVLKQPQLLELRDAINMML